MKNTNRQLLDKQINPDSEKVYLSIASVGEIKAMALINNWGRAKLQIMELMLNEIPMLEINENFIDTYAQIDAFSQRRHSGYSEYSFATPKNMGKNDLWIAATAALLGLKLVTTDADFNHLNKIFIEVRLLKPESLTG